MPKNFSTIWNRKNYGEQFGETEPSTDLLTGRHNWGPARPDIIQVEPVGGPINREFI